MHKIRKTYGTMLLDNQAREALVARQMGHADMIRSKPVSEDRSPPSKFILICLLLSKAKVFTILIKGSFGLFFKIRHLNFTTNGCSFFIHLIGEKQYSVKI